MNERTARRATLRWLTAALVATLAACGGSGGGNGAVWTPVQNSTPADPGQIPMPLAAIQIRTTSNRADLVSGGDVTLEVVLPSGAQASTLKVAVGGRDVSDAFATAADGRITGYVSGLVDGENVVSASASGARAASLAVTNHPRGGPVLSGPQITPFFCATPQPQAATSSTPATAPSGLGTVAVDAQCNIATEFKLYYKSTAANCALGLPDPFPAVNFAATTPPALPAPNSNNCFKPYDPAAPRPGDLATTTTNAGATVPFIVRVERGTLNRGIYDIATLFDPTRDWTARSPQPQWSGKVYYPFGADTGQPRRQVRPATNWPTGADVIGRGYLWVANSMTDSGANSNRLVMAETVMMMKEHIAETYGPIRYTIATGCSGGAINSNVANSLAPGLLDGVIVTCTFPDQETTGIEVSDCAWLVEAYAKPAWSALMAGLTPAQIDARKGAINGHPDASACNAWFNAFGGVSKPGIYTTRFVDASGNIATGASTNNCQLPASLVYSPTSNPTGARCSGWDWSASIFGKTADGSRALITRDNEGVQYGLSALLSGAISAEEFVTINEIVGGSNGDYEAQPARSVADSGALGIAYRSGLVASGRQMAGTAMIDLRGYDDSSMPTPGGASSAYPVHHIWRSFSMRERLDKSQGDHGNHVMWRFGRNGLSPSPALQREALDTLDAWLAAVGADTGSAPLAAKVRSHKPAGASDFCLLSSDATQSTRITDMAVCEQDPFLKPSRSPRQVAGGPLAEDILKCALKPMDITRYHGLLTASQQARLAAVFPNGVCDWTRPGIGQQDAISPAFVSREGLRALPPAPASRTN